MKGQLLAAVLTVVGLVVVFKLLGLAGITPYEAGYAAGKALVVLIPLAVLGLVGFLVYRWVR